MKTLRNIFTVILFTAFITSCTPSEIDNDSPNLSNDISATGGDSETTVDNDRD